MATILCHSLDEHQRRKPEPKLTVSNYDTWSWNFPVITVPRDDCPVCCNQGALELEKLIVWPLGVILGLALAFYAYNRFEQRPKVAKSFWDIPLGASRSDVKFIKGEPSDQDSDRWTYLTTDQSGNWRHVYYVYFREEKVWAVAYYSSHEYDWRENVQGINVGASIDALRQKFGEPSHTAVSDDQLRKIHSYSKYNTIFELAKNKVVGIGIYDPAVKKNGVRFASDDKKKSKPK